MKHKTETCGTCVFWVKGVCNNMYGALMGKQVSSGEQACSEWAEEPLTEDEYRLYYAVKDKGGSFDSRLFELICAADIWNQAKLKKGFPGFVTAVQRYQSERGYWESVQRKVSTDRKHFEDQDNKRRDV